MTYMVTLVRQNGKRTSDEKINDQINYLIERALAGSRRGWEVKSRTLAPAKKLPNGLTEFRCNLTFEKVKGHKLGEAEWKQWEAITSMLEQTGAGAKFAQYPWKLIKGKTETTKVESDGTAASMPAVEVNDSSTDDDDAEDKGKVPGVRTVLQAAAALKWSDLHVPPELLDRDKSDAALADHPCFKDIYARGPQIRTILANIQAAIESDGVRRFHSVLWGPPACAKTSVMLAVEKLLGQGAFLKLDATSTTRAGIEKLFFDELKDIPPIVYMEEIEKVQEDVLKVWLGALDDRGELRKVNFRQTKVREVRILFFCTCNDKDKFDRMMAGSDGGVGALSSRCVSDIYFPRPGKETLRRILEREIRQKGGKMEWINPALALAEQLHQNDPRRVQSYLAGGDRLLDNSYQDDILQIHRQSKDQETGV